MKKYKLILSYDGSDFSGWQVQPNGVSIQETLEKALETLLKEKISIVGSGRTDAGVHALQQPAHFSYEGDLPCRKIQYALNGMLPRTIRVLGLMPINASFHAQHGAKSKCYYYYLNLAATASPFHRQYSWHIARYMDLSLLQEAARYFIGTHDFTSFSNEPHKGACKINPVRTITRIDFVPWEGGIRLEFEGSGFLYKMVRNIVGALYEVGYGKLQPEDIPKILAAKDRKAAGVTAPPHGLFLAYVNY